MPTFMDVVKSPAAAYDTIIEFEARVATAYGGGWAVGVSSATSGILASLLAVGVGRGDDVLVPGLSWPGTWFPAAFLGARLVPVDFSVSWPVMDARRCWQRQPDKAAAILSVALFGHVDGIVEIDAAAASDEIPHILDAAQLSGGAGAGLPLTDLADLVVVSFGPGKSVACGGGGAVIGTDEQLRERLLLITQHPFRVGAEVDDAGLRRLADGFSNNLAIHPAAAWTYLALTEAGGNAVSGNDGRERAAAILDRHGAERLLGVLWSPVPPSGPLLATLPADDRDGYAALSKTLGDAGWTAARCHYRPLDEVLARRGSLYPWGRYQLDVLMTDLSTSRRWADDLVIVTPGVSGNVTSKKGRSPR